MRTVYLSAALLGAVFLGACRSPDITDRLDTGGLHTTVGAPNFAMSATRDDRELHQSLTAVSMKDDRDGSLVISDRARQLISAYAN